MVAVYVRKEKLGELCPKVERKLVLDVEVEKALSLIFKALNEMGLENLTVKYSVPSPPLCENCARNGKNTSLQWIWQYERWFCYVCYEYAPPSARFKPSYLILTYTSGRTLLGNVETEIEISFEDNKVQTTVLIKWFYPSFSKLLEEPDETVENITYTYDRSFGETEVEKRITRTVSADRVALWKLKSNQAKDHVERMLEILRNEIGAREITVEKQVITKIRCPYCNVLYDETLYRCPNCGGH